MKIRIKDDELFLMIGLIAFLILWYKNGIEWVINTFLQFIFFSTIIWYIAQKIHKKFEE